MVQNNLISLESNEEVLYVDELLRELQNETSNDWGYWHFSLLNLVAGDNLSQRINHTLIEIPSYNDPYWVDTVTGSRTYRSFTDLKNLTLQPVPDFKNEFLKLAEHWASYEGTTNGTRRISERFHSLKYEVADKIAAFLQSKEINEVALVCGVDILYTSGGDEIGQDILIETKAGVYVIHFGFSA